MISFIYNMLLFCSFDILLVFFFATVQVLNAVVERSERDSDVTKDLTAILTHYTCYYLPLTAHYHETQLQKSILSNTFKYLF